MSKKQTDQPSNPDIKVVIDTFFDTFVARHGFKPDPREWGRFAKDLGPLLSAWGREKLLQLVADFFDSTDPRVLRSDYKPSDFLRLAQYLHIKRNGGRTIDSRTASNLDAARRATQRHH